MKRHKSEHGPVKQGPVIIHRDDGVVIVDKPPDVLTSGGHDAMDGILSRFLEEEDGEKPQYLTHCHQLDAPTSGVLCFALSKAASGQVSASFEGRHTRKVYRALVQGHVAPGVHLHDIAIAASPADPRGYRQMPGTPANPGRPCVTHAKVLGHGTTLLSSGASIPCTLIQLYPLTGRTHQLRVHMSAAGHPIVGDTTYAPHLKAQRLMLHALRLELPLEARGDHRTITAEAPDPFGAYFVASTSATLSENSYPSFTDHRCARYHAAGVLPYIVIATPDGGREVKLLLQSRPRRNPNGAGFAKGRVKALFWSARQKSDADAAHTAANALTSQLLQSLKFRLNMSDGATTLAIDRHREADLYRLSAACVHSTHDLARALRRGGPALGCVVMHAGSGDVDTVVFLLPIATIAAEALVARLEDEKAAQKVTGNARIRGVDVLDYHWVGLKELQAEAVRRSDEQAHSRRPGVEPLLLRLLGSDECVRLLERLGGNAEGVAEGEDSARCTIHPYSYEGDQLVHLVSDAKSSHGAQP